MTHYYDDPMDEKGNYPYRHFDEYFLGPKRVAYLLYDENTLIGFAMLNPYSCVDRNPDYTMAEFTIFPAYRRKHIAFDFVEEIV